MRDIKDQYNYKPHDMAKAQLEYFLNRGMSFHAIVNTALDRMYREEIKMDKTYFVSVGTEPIRGTWQQKARFDYREAASYAAKVVKDNPHERITVWDQNFEAVVVTPTGIEVDSECYRPEYEYIVVAIRNALDNK